VPSRVRENKEKINSFIPGRPFTGALYLGDLIAKSTNFVQ
jgi:hypothetical protein